MIYKKILLKEFVAPSILRADGDVEIDLETGSTVSKVGLDYMIYDGVEISSSPTSMEGID